MPKKSEYDVKAIESAISDLKDSKISLRAAAKKYGIPKSTLAFKLKNPGHKHTCGPLPILTSQEELQLVNWIEELAKRGFPRKKEDVFNSVQKFLIENPRSNPFNNNRPGECWFKGFLRRHPTIVMRTTEAVSAASACVSEANIRKWFKEIENYLASKNIDISDPSRVWNGDETGFQICPNTGKVFAAKGTKNVYTIDKGSPKENITVMFSFSASGLSCPPMIVYAYKRVPEKISGNVNPTWGIGRSDNGWMTSDIFYDYINNIFYPYLVEINVSFPVILFLDGHKSHLTYELSTLCNELNIEIIALYPNATRILQPCDVAVFRPIKIGWRKAVREFYGNNPGQVLNKTSFAPLLEKVVGEVVKPETLINGFKACGLCPFNPDAIDFSKCLGKDDKPEEATYESSKIMNYKMFLDFLGDDLTKKFKSLDLILNNQDFNDEFFRLYKMWKFFEKDDKTENDAGNLKEVEGPELITTPDENEANPEAIDDRELIIESVENVDSGFIAHPTNLNKVHIIANVVIKSADTSTSSTYMPHTLSIPSTSKSPISNYLEIPDPPQRKGKRDTERIPFAITSRVYQEMYEKKRDLKLEEEKKKLERKRKREAVSAAKSNNETNKKIRKVKSTVIVNNCFVCKKRITKSNNLTCDSCRNHFHLRCVPNEHKKHVPDQDDDDPFMCHICYKEESEDDSEEKEESEEEANEMEKSVDNVRSGENEEMDGDTDKKAENVDNLKNDGNEERKEDGIAKEENEADAKSDEEIDDLYNFYKTESVKYYC